jgi:hypothetical protein
MTEVKHLIIQQCDPNSIIYQKQFTYLWKGMSNFKKSGGSITSLSLNLYSAPLDEGRLYSVLRSCSELQALRIETMTLTAPIGKAIGKFINDIKFLTHLEFKYCDV